MRVRNILRIAVLCIVTVTAFGQTRKIGGKWGTAGAASETAMTMMLDLRVDARNNVTGSITQYAVPFCGSANTRLPIARGTVVGKIVTFETSTPNSCPGAETPQATWTGTLGDDDSLSLTRTVAGFSGAAVAPAATGTQNPPVNSASRNPVQGMTTPPIQGMTTPPIQGMATPPIQPSGTSSGNSGGGRGSANDGRRSGPGGIDMAMVMHRL